MEKLNLQNDNVIKISVNDEDDLLVINLADRDFPNRFYQLIQHVEQNIAELEAKKDDIGTMGIREQIDADLAVHRTVMEDIDNLFGEETCKKVFGDIVPDISLILDFFDKLTPIIQKYSKKRNDRIQQKYSANRKGGAR